MFQIACCGEVNSFNYLVSQISTSPKFHCHKSTSWSASHKKGAATIKLGNWPILHNKLHYLFIAEIATSFLLSVLYTSYIGKCDLVTEINPQTHFPLMT